MAGPVDVFQVSEESKPKTTDIIPIRLAIIAICIGVEDKFLEAFRKGRNQCKKCENAKSKIQEKKKREEDINNNKTQNCKECGVKKTITEFKLGSLKCKECRNKKQCDVHKENVLDSVAHSMRTNTPKDKKTIQDYKKILTQLMKNQENKLKEI